MIKYDVNINELIEKTYEIKKEAHHATLFTVGNGYYGVRGSFEEFGPVSVQGSFIRGLFDEIIEIPQIFVDNIYMRKYYINELEAKRFEYQDSAINFADFLFVRFKIGNQTFYPWEGKILKWKRYIDTSDGSLVRDVLWDDGKGNVTEFKFKRLASFENNHVFILKAEARRVNHKLECEIISGIDTLVKTNGQRKSKLMKYELKNGIQQYLFNIGEKYNNEVAVGIRNNFYGIKEKENKLIFKDDTYYEKSIANEDVFGIEKIIYSNSTVDYKEKVDLLKLNFEHFTLNKTFEDYYKEHLTIYQQEFDVININIENNEDDALLRFANYHTLISVDRYDAIHSVSAKNLTGEKYNQFIWWDAEIFQYPIYLMTNPEAAKNLLLYRYNRLEQSKINAKEDGLDGVKFAFCSSVKGDEKVWSYARHPFMQIHINSDVAYAILNYYETTGDLDFIKDYGLEMLIEISKYFLSRVEYNKELNIYELNQVTGTDEHHPYVNNNSYTNYMVKYLLKETIKYYQKLNVKHLSLTNEEISKMEDVINKLKFEITEEGYIPQFDNYFNLSKELEVTGFGAAKNFQMKESGLYHESQIIKQPDVVMLFTYINIDLPNNANYLKNWHYYEKMCEKSSSLTYPVHAVAAIDHLEYDKFYDYWYQSAAIDIIDLHNEAYLGVHAASMAGAWYSIYRGLFGVKARLDYLEVNPKYLNRFGDVDIKFYYKNELVEMKLTQNELHIKSNHSFSIKHKEKIVLHENKSIIKF